MAPDVVNGPDNDRVAPLSDVAVSVLDVSAADALSDTTDAVVTVRDDADTEDEESDVDVIGPPMTLAAETLELTVMVAALSDDTESEVAVATPSTDDELVTAAVDTNVEDKPAETVIATADSVPLTNVETPAWPITTSELDVPSRNAPALKPVPASRTRSPPTLEASPDACPINAVVRPRLALE